MKKNIIGFSLSEKLEFNIGGYNKTIENRQVELEDKINQLILEFQKNEKVVVLVDYNSYNFNTKPIETRLIVDLKQ